MQTSQKIINDYHSERRRHWKKVLEAGRIDDDGMIHVYCPFHILKDGGAISSFKCKCVFDPVNARFDTDCEEKGDVSRLSIALQKTRSAEYVRRMEQEVDSIPSRVAIEKIEDQKKALP